MKKSTLTVVGTGIKFLSHITMEAKAYIEKADVVFYLVNEPAIKQWIKNLNPNNEDLDKIYFKHKSRLESYRSISHYIVSKLRQNKNICIALYGHPNDFASPALDAVNEARKNGHIAKILPGISAESCLYSDLSIDTGKCGRQSFEATDFILHERIFDPNSHLILLQPDVIGERGHDEAKDGKGLFLLRDYLLRYYPSDHEIIIYEAAQYPGISSKILSSIINDLPKLNLSPISTLYVKPLGKSLFNKKYAKILNIN